MSYIERIGYHLGRRDEVPNQELGKEIAEKEDARGIQEMVSYLEDRNKSVASDCLKVLYEAAYIKPELIVPYTDTFVALLSSKNNRMVWGSMIALANIAEAAPDQVYAHINKIEVLIETGSLITHVSGVRALITMAGGGYYDQLKDRLFDLQSKCRPIDFAKRAELMMPVIVEEDLPAYLEILELRKSDLSKAAQKRLDKVIRQIHKKMAT